MERIVTVDWSGAKTGAADRIFCARVEDGRVTALQGGRGRTEVVDHLLTLADEEPALRVGRDFAFGFPAWFATSLGDSPLEVWQTVARDGEAWLRDCPRPFWGRPGRTRPELPAHLRRSEVEVGRIAGIRPASVLQIGGAGAVGTGSIRGMPELLRLREAGFSVWPFDAPDPPVVFEIWPRLFTGPVVKSDPKARAAWIARFCPGLDARVSRIASKSEDAFDALASGLGMARDLEAIRRLTRAPAGTPEAIEGAILDAVPRRPGSESERA